MILCSYCKLIHPRHPLSGNISSRNPGNLIQEDGEDEAYREKLNNAILISQYHDEQEIWLIPENQAKTRWQTWFFAAWKPSETKYPGFRYYLEDQLQSAEDYLFRQKNGRDKSEKIE
jgi:hypothetical protein